MIGNHTPRAKPNLACLLALVNLRGWSVNAARRPDRIEPGPGSGSP